MSANYCYQCSGYECDKDIYQTCPDSTYFCQKVISKLNGVQITLFGCSNTCVDGNYFKYGSIAAQ